MASTENVYLRLPPGLWAKIKFAAADEGRSANAEAVIRLKASFAQEPEKP